MRGLGAWGERREGAAASARAVSLLSVTAMSGFFEAAAQYDAEPGALHALIEGNPAMLGRSDTAGLTLLHYACKEGHLDAVIQLVEVRAKEKNKEPARADLSP